MREYDLIKESKKTTAQELAGLRSEIALLRGSLEDAIAVMTGVITKEKVNKL